MSARPHTDAMVAARRAASAAKRARVLAAVDHLVEAGAPVSFAAVARYAGVSTWLVYTPGLREVIDAAQARQTRAAVTTEPAARTNPAGLASELALARDEIARLRAERHQHQRQLQAALGARVDQAAKADLVERVEELTRRNKELAAALAEARAETNLAAGRVGELEDQLAATRTSLRRMIRAENRPVALTPIEGGQR